MKTRSILHTLAAPVLLALTAGFMAACSVHDDNPTGEPFVEPETDFAPAGAEAVDLGLPSGTKWANMNVGAEAPEDYGLYFAWGETVGYTSDTNDGRLFNWANYKWMNEGKSSWKQIKKYQIQDGQTSACWYQFNEDSGDYEFIGDGKAVLDPEDDAAHVNWGGKWRMPTLEEIEELLSNTTAEWTKQNNITGYKFTSTVNGNTIFLPATGYRFNSEIGIPTMNGYYWSSSLYDVSQSSARNISFSYAQLKAGGLYRCYGLSVRPVQ